MNSDFTKITNIYRIFYESNNSKIKYIKTTLSTKIMRELVKSGEMSLSQPVAVAVSTMFHSLLLHHVREQQLIRIQIFLIIASF